VTIVKADVQLAPNGTGFTTNCQPSNPQRNALWFRYTLPAGVQYISFGVTGINYSASYSPYVSVWKETTPGVYTQFHERFGANNYCYDLVAPPGYTNSFLILGAPGTTYLFQVQQGNTGAIDYDLTVLVTHAPTGGGVAGDLLIPDDLNPYPVAILRSASGALSGYLAYDKNWWGEEFSVIQQGGWVCNRQATSGATYGACCFGPPPTFDLLSTTDLRPWGTSFQGFCSDQVNKHYVAQSGGGLQYLHRFDAATGVKEQTWTLPARMSIFLGVHTASGTVYYTDYDNYSTVHRYNLTTSSSLADFLPDSGFYRSEGFVLPDGTIGIATEDSETWWDVYDPTGTLLQHATREYHRFSLDNALTGIWFWEQHQQSFSHARIATLDVNDATVTSPDPVISFSGGPTGPSYNDRIWGYSDSCPVLVYPLLGPPEPPDGDISQVCATPLPIDLDSGGLALHRLQLETERRRCLTP